MRRSPSVLRPFAALTLVLALAALTLPAAAGAAGEPATVTVRVEGAAQTLLPPTTVTTNTTPVTNDGNQAHSCPGTDAIGALQLATNGDWSGSWFEGFGYSVESVLGESHTFTSPAFWSLWFDNKQASQGICELELHDGDSLLLFPECNGECPAGPSVLGVEAPAVAAVGAEVPVKVIAYANASGAPSPAAEATVSYEGTNAQTDASGQATLKFAHAGRALVSVTKSQTIRTEAFVCVHDGNDGTCGTSGPGPAGETPVLHQAPYKGPYALVAQPSAPLDGHRYPAAHAPRLISGTIVAHSAVDSVSVELRRSFHGRCSAFDATRVRFVHEHCGNGSFFGVATGASYSYLLPAALPRGRYVLDVLASDVAGNHTTLARGTSRVVFYVG